MRKVFYKIFRESVIKSSFGSCGKNVHIAEKSDIKGIGNISIGIMFFCGLTFVSTVIGIGERSARIAGGVGGVQPS